MVNVGNSCYINASLQAIFHVPSFCNWLLSDEVDQHLDACKTAECMICAVKKTLKQSQDKTKRAITPSLILEKLEKINNLLILQRQEDAHEFLTALLYRMIKSFLATVPDADKLSYRSKTTTPIGQLFGGSIVSTLFCPVCHRESPKYDPFNSLELPMKTETSTLDDALALYFNAEEVDAIDCSFCKMKLTMEKTIALAEGPNVLYICLERFGENGVKNNNHVQAPQYLDLEKYTTSGKDVKYKLVSTVSHVGTSVQSGHYTAAAHTKNGV